MEKVTRTGGGCPKCGSGFGTRPETRPRPSTITPPAHLQYPPRSERTYGRAFYDLNSGQYGSFHAAAYSASKWGLIGPLKSAARELGKHGIKMNCLVPGLIKTPLTRHEEGYVQALEISGKDLLGMKQSMIRSRRKV